MGHHLDSLTEMTKVTLSVLYSGYLLEFHLEWSKELRREQYLVENLELPTEQLREQQKERRLGQMTENRWKLPKEYRLEYLMATRTVKESLVRRFRGLQLFLN